MNDATACTRGIAALIQLYGECPPDHFEPDCIACRAGVFIRDMRDMRAELRCEAQRDATVARQLACLS